MDDVNSAQVVEALNIGCKTLVTTLDQNVMNNSGDRYIPIKVNYCSYNLSVDMMPVTHRAYYLIVVLEAIDNIQL